MHEATFSIHLSFSLQYSWCLPSPERVLDCNVAVYSDGQQAEDGALSEYEDEASDEQAAEEVGTEAGTDVDLQENVTGYKNQN